MIPFNIDDAKAGKNVVSNQGNKVKRFYFIDNPDAPVIAIFDTFNVAENGDGNSYEYIRQYDLAGHCTSLTKSDKELYMEEQQIDIHLWISEDDMISTTVFFRMSDKPTISAGRNIKGYKGFVTLPLSAFVDGSDNKIGFSKKIKWPPPLK